MCEVNSGEFEMIVQVCSSKRILKRLAEKTVQQGFGVDAKRK